MDQKKVKGFDEILPACLDKTDTTNGSSLSYDWFETLLWRTVAWIMFSVCQQKPLFGKQIRFITSCLQSVYLDTLNQLILPAATILKEKACMSCQNNIKAWNQERGRKKTDSWRHSIIKQVTRNILPPEASIHDMSTVKHCIDVYLADLISIVWTKHCGESLTFKLWKYCAEFIFCAYLLIAYFDQPSCVHDCLHIMWPHKPVYKNHVTIRNHLTDCPLIMYLSSWFASCEDHQMTLTLPNVLS